MVTLGTDSHKRSHTLVAVDEHGRKLGELRVDATPTGHVEALSWAQQWSDRRWAMENCRQLSRGLERDLLKADEQVLQVSPKLMGTSRRSGREPGKSDPIDALAVARVALREADLPVARREGRSRELKLLVDHREDLVGERTRVQNRLHWYLHELDPELGVGKRKLTRKVVLAELRRRVEAHEGVVAEIVCDLIERMTELTIRADQLQRRIEALATELAPNLMRMAGCAGLTAGKLVAETADVGRFRSSSAFAMHNGTAPIPVWSGNVARHRLNRGGNRQPNVALHRIAMTRVGVGGAARASVARGMAVGNTRTEAIGSLGGHLATGVYEGLRLDGRAHLCAAQPE